MTKLATIGVGTIGALCLASSAMANRVILSNNSDKPVTVKYHVVYRDKQNQAHVGARRVITLGAHQQRKITFHLRKKTYAGLALTQVIKYGDESISMPALEQELGSKDSCTVATDKSNRHAQLEFQVTEQGDKHNLTCTPKGGVAI